MDGHLNDYLNPRATDESRHLSLVDLNVSGGRITKDTIDLIADFPDVREVSISGLTQETFEYFIATYGRQFKAILFWKCPLVEDLRAIESLTDVEYVVYFWNQRADRLWDLSKTEALKGFAYDDFTRLHNISEITRSSSIEEFQFGDRVWAKYVVDSLEPLRRCRTIRHLAFSAKKIVDGRIEPIADLVNLESLSFSNNLFTTEQVAWLKAHLPSTVKSRSLQAYWQIDKPLAMDGKNKDTFIVGKRKPFLDSKQDKGRIDKYVLQFDSMRRWYLANPEARPEDYKR